MSIPYHAITVLSTLLYRAVPVLPHCNEPYQTVLDYAAPYRATPCHIPYHTTLSRPISCYPIPSCPPPVLTQSPPGLVPAVSRRDVYVSRPIHLSQHIPSHPGPSRPIPTHPFTSHPVLFGPIRPHGWVGWWKGMGWGGMGCDGMEWDGMRWDGMGWGKGVVRV